MAKNKKPIVWLVNRNAGHDYSGAEKYGDLVPLTEGLAHPFATDRFLALVHERLARFGEEDYLLLSGHLLLNAVALGYLARKFGWLRLLVLHMKSRTYVERFLDYRHLNVHVERLLEVLKEKQPETKRRG